MKKLFILLGGIVGFDVYGSAGVAVSTAPSIGGGFFAPAICQSAIGPTSSFISSDLVLKEEYEQIAEAMRQLYPWQTDCTVNSVRHIVSHLAVQSLYGCKLDGYYDDINYIREPFGKQYESLVPSEKIAFCVARGVDAFFKGDLVNASAFLLEARQINIVKLPKLEELDFCPLAAVLYDLRFAIDSRANDPLTDEQATERAFFSLCFSKLLDARHSANIRKNAQVFLRLVRMNAQDQVKLKGRNSDLYGHLVYLTAQYAVSKILKNKRVDGLDEIANLIITNLDFFKGDSLYREEGQRLYLSVIGTVVPAFFDRAFLVLKEFSDRKYTGIVGGTTETPIVVYSPDKSVCLDRIIEYAILRKAYLPENFLTTIEQVSANLPIPISISPLLERVEGLSDQERSFSLLFEEDAAFARITS